MKKYRIIYNSNPKHPKEYDFIGNKEDLTSQEEREFNKIEDAINFWYKCTSPITQLMEFYPDFKEKYPDYQEKELIEILTTPENREIKKVICNI